jgi:hypothetical protein
MPRELPSGTRSTEAYELLSRDTSVDLPNGAPLQHDDTHLEPTSFHRRVRFSRSRSEDAPRGEEVVGLLARPPFDISKRLHLSGGLRIGVELVTQSTPSLLFAVLGSVMTGVVFDQVQFWPAFVKIRELFILVPILLNLKGCLEMNLASRLSTSVECLKPLFLTLGKYWGIGH